MSREGTGGTEGAPKGATNAQGWASDGEGVAASPVYGAAGGRTHCKALWVGLRRVPTGPHAGTGW